MSKGMRIVCLVLLMFLSSMVFGIAQKAGSAQVGAFFAFMTLGILVAIVFVALGRGQSQRR